MTSSEWANHRSCIAGSESTPYPIQNLPYGAFRREGEAHLGVAIGELILDLTALERKGLLMVDGQPCFQEGTLNGLMAAGRVVWRAVRERLQELLDANSTELLEGSSPAPEWFVDRENTEMLLPVEIGDYTDFYSSKYHAQNVGTMFRGADNALMPNYLELPVAYHGRASSVILSGQPVHRPCGQIHPKGFERPIYESCRLLDYELEMGFFVGPGTELGEMLGVDDAEQEIFGFVIVNDWSARDVQTWEYQPLGPFNAKNFATSISPWVVTMDALDPFRINGPEQNPQPLDYLRGKSHWSLDIPLTVLLQTASMDSPVEITRSNYRHLYWTPAQQLAHHTSTGCNLRPGDLLASGTISGPEKNSRGCLLELTWRGEEPLTLPNGETRTFLEDGDRVIMRAECEREGVRIGFGEVSSTVLPADGEA